MTIPIHNLEDHDFGKHSKTERNPRARLRLLILYQYSMGKATNDIAKDIQQLAEEHYNAHYTVNGIYELLKRIDMSWISARSQHPKADPQAQDAFKKTL